MREKRRIIKTRILLASSLLIIALLSVYGCCASAKTALGLEQSVRCGTDEHFHTVECYIDDVMICGQKAHFHGENCYLLLPADNDINRLLDLAALEEDKSLESVLRGVLNEALGAGRAMYDTLKWQAMSDGDYYTNDDIAMLNRAISDGVLSSGLVLNEQLTSAFSSAKGYSEAETLVYLASGGSERKKATGLQQPS